MKNGYKVGFKILEIKNIKQKEDNENIFTADITYYDKYIQKSIEKTIEGNEKTIKTLKVYDNYFDLLSN